MQLKKLGSFALVVGLTAGAVGCVVRAHGHVRVPAPVAYVEIEEEPPPPRAVIIETRPGFVFIQGRWIRSGNQWVWRDGYWERQRVGHVWQDGRWERRGRGHVWVEGSWRAGAATRVEHHDNGRHQGHGPAVRDHRDHRREEPAPPPPGPKVRDHRR
jgi:hypothetical protein